MRAVAIIQARMGSTRLPGKVMMDLCGRPVLSRVVDRTLRAGLLNQVLVATTTEVADKVIVEHCWRWGWPCFRGSEGDVLDRYYQAALESKAEVVVRITSDCPLIDPGIIDQVVRELLEHEVDYVSNTLPPRTFPRGLDVEALSFEALARAWREDQNLAWREHVTPYIYEHPDRFRLRGVTNAIDYSHMRWTVDTAEDLAFVRLVYDYFGSDTFSWKQVLQVLQENPEWQEINRHISQKQVPR